MAFFQDKLTQQTLKKQITNKMRTSIQIGKIRPGVVLGAILALCIMVFVTGCKKNEVPPNPKEETATIKSSAVPPNPGYGSSTTVTYNVEGTCGKFFAIYKGDTVTKVCSGSFILKNLTESGYVDFTCILESSKRIVKGALFIPVGSAPTPPILTVSYDTSTVPYLGSKVIHWSATNADSVVDAKGKNVGNPNSIQLGSLTKDTNLVRKAINKTGVDIKTINIKVAPIVLPTRSDSLVGSWHQDAQLYLPNNSTGWIDYPLLDCQKDDTLKLLSTGKYEQHQGVEFCFTNLPELSGKGDWFLLPGGLQVNFGNGIYTIEKLTGTELIWTTIQVGGLGGGGINKSIYHRY